MRSGFTSYLGREAIQTRKGTAAVMSFEKDLVLGRHFLIGTVEIPPYIIIKRDHNGTLLQVDGFVHQIVQFLAKKFQFTYEYVEPPNGITGSCVNKTCNGLIGMLIRGEIDMIATGLAMTLSRFHMIDYTFPFESDPITLLIPYPKKDSTLKSILKPFSTEVWILLVLSMVIYAYLMSWAGYLRARWFNRSYHGTTDNLESSREIARQPGKFADDIMFLLSVLVNRKFLSKYQKHPRPFYSGFTVIAGNHIPPGFGEAFRILVAVWCLIAVVISNSYNTSIKSFLTLPKYRPVIKSLNDLTENSKYSFAAKKHSSVWSNMIEAQTGPFAKIGELLRKHPENSLDILDDDKDYVIYQKKVLAQFQSSNLFVIQEDMKSSGKCRLYTAEKPFDELRISFGLPKNSPIENHFLSHEVHSEISTDMAHRVFSIFLRQLAANVPNLD
ncbi:glutamate [NMDA] receptor subunit 1 isoform X3 [Daphnia magna]|uniref:glutamate [NMDA] receptor subunit 1 isoform X3 n=1 Tax=Daphnia magna TaxID=35525 RepID=UPI001E1BC02C|nr:glutamate [NMDA] receptor subunit 1 isoform X3 [Daphnia magna]